MLSDWIVVRITSSPGSSFLDRMIALVEGTERQKTPNEIALNILLAGMTISDFRDLVTENCGDRLRPPGPQYWHYPHDAVPQ